MITAKLSQDKKKLILEVDFSESGMPSKTGKTIVHSSTHGNQSVGIDVKGRPLVVGLNAYTSNK